MGGGGDHNPDVERRATVRLVHYWKSICRNDALPAFVDFDPHRNPIEWDRCVLASCAGPRDFTLEHVGAILAELDSRTGQIAARDSAPTGLVARMLEPLPEVLANPAPRHGDGDYLLPGHGRVLFRSVLLPFRSVVAQRRYVLGAATFKLDRSMAADEAEDGIARDRPAQGESVNAAS